jgi:hypothetical protein
MLTTSLWLAEQYSSPKVLLHYRATIWRVQLADDDNRAQKYIVTRPQRMIGSEVVREEERERCVTCLFRCERERLLADATGWKKTPIPKELREKPLYRGYERAELRSIDSATADGRHGGAGAHDTPL